MKDLTLLLISLFTPVFLLSQPVKPAKDLQYLLKQKDYFTLDSQFKKEESQISSRDRLYFDAFLMNAFNQCKTSIANINKLLRLHSSSLHDSIKAELVQLLEDDYVKIYEYKSSGS